MLDKQNVCSRESTVFYMNLLFITIFLLLFLDAITHAANIKAH